MVLRIVSQLLKIQMALDDLHSWTKVPGNTYKRGQNCAFEKFLVTRGRVGRVGLGGGLLFVAQPEEAGQDRCHINPTCSIQFRGHPQKQSKN